jgi:hypothetical protein
MPSSGATVPTGPLAPPRRASFVQGSVNESPRSRSILAGAKLSQATVNGPKREQIFATYGGDLFSQRGEYEDGMIYLSRFRKPGTIAMTGFVDLDGEPNQDQVEEADEEVHEKLQEALDAGTVLSREVRLKQECAFSLYHVSLSLSLSLSLSFSDTRRRTEHSLTS